MQSLRISTQTCGLILAREQDVQRNDMVLRRLIRSSSQQCDRSLYLASHHANSLQPDSEIRTDCVQVGFLATNYDFESKVEVNMSLNEAWKIRATSHFGPGGIPHGLMEADTIDSRRYVRTCCHIPALAQ